MKRLLSVGLSLVLASAAWADQSTTVHLNGWLTGTAGTGLENTAQKDGDLLKLSYNGKNAGASVGLYTDSASSAAAVKLRGLQLWYQVNPATKLTLGSIGLYTYVEQIDWWQTPAGASLVQVNAWDTRWNSPVFNNDNPGAQVEIKAAKNLTLGLGASGSAYGTKVLVPDSADLMAGIKYGGFARYEFKDTGSVALAFADHGVDQEKLVRLGFDYKKIKGLYFFVDGILRLDNTVKTGVVSTDPLGLAGVAIDTYASLTQGAFQLQAHVPVTLRLTGTQDLAVTIDSVNYDFNDVSYLQYDVKASYSLPKLKLTPFVRATDDVVELGNSGIDLDLASPVFEAGTEIGGWDSATLKVSFQYTLAATPTWSVPFAATVSF